ncbi:hypothetical protein BJ742DRAFT_405639 [Cladochytrium replicatum]|nr:hypothetical protein BJ742DRAFT_405639 [Cladochytrium replicatum]
MNPEQLNRQKLYERIMMSSAVGQAQALITLAEICCGPFLLNQQRLMFQTKSRSSPRLQPALLISSGVPASSMRQPATSNSIRLSVKVTISADAGRSIDLTFGSRRLTRILFGQDRHPHFHPSRRRCHHGRNWDLQPRDSRGKGCRRVSPQLTTLPTPTVRFRLPAPPTVRSRASCCPPRHRNRAEAVPVPFHYQPYWKGGSQLPSDSTCQFAARF